MALETLHPALSAVDVFGDPLTARSRVIIALHGVGGNEDRLGAFAERAAGGIPEVTVLAPDSAYRNWWRGRLNRSMSPDQPQLVEALDAVEAVVEYVLGVGVPADRIVLLGFSQGACLALEHAVRAGRRYRAVVSMSGVLLGVVDGNHEDTWGYDRARNLGGMRFKLSVHEGDRKVPLEYVERTRDVLEDAGANVTLRVEGGSRHGLMRADADVIHDLVASDD